MKNWTGRRHDSEPSLGCGMSLFPQHRSRQRKLQLRGEKAQAREYTDSSLQVELNDAANSNTLTRHGPTASDGP